MEVGTEWEAERDATRVVQTCSIEKGRLRWADDRADGGRRSKVEGETENTMGGLREKGYEYGKCN